MLKVKTAEKKPTRLIDLVDQRITPVNSFTAAPHFPTPPARTKEDLIKQASIKHRLMKTMTSSRNAVIHLEDTGFEMEFRQEDTTQGAGPLPPHGLVTKKTITWTPEKGEESTEVKVKVPQTRAMRRAVSASMIATTKDKNSKKKSKDKSEEKKSLSSRVFKSVSEPNLAPGKTKDKSGDTKKGEKKSLREKLGFKKKSKKVKFQDGTGMEEISKHEDVEIKEEKSQKAEAKQETKTPTTSIIEPENLKDENENIAKVPEVKVASVKRKEAPNEYHNPLMDNLRQQRRASSLGKLSSRSSSTLDDVSGLQKSHPSPRYSSVTSLPSEFPIGGQKTPTNPFESTDSSLDSTSLEYSRKDSFSNPFYEPPNETPMRRHRSLRSPPTTPSDHVITPRRSASVRAPPMCPKDPPKCPSAQSTPKAPNQVKSQLASMEMSAKTPTAVVKPVETTDQSEPLDLTCPGCGDELNKNNQQNIDLQMEQERHKLQNSRLPPALVAQLPLLAKQVMYTLNHSRDVDHDVALDSIWRPIMSLFGLVRARKPKNWRERSPNIAAMMICAPCEQTGNKVCEYTSDAVDHALEVAESPRLKRIPSGLRGKIPLMVERFSVSNTTQQIEAAMAEDDALSHSDNDTVSTMSFDGHLVGEIVKTSFGKMAVLTPKMERQDSTQSTKSLRRSDSRQSAVRIDNVYDVIWELVDQRPAGMREISTTQIRSLRHINGLDLTPGGDIIVAGQTKAKRERYLHVLSSEGRKKAPIPYDGHIVWQVQCVGDEIYLGDCDSGCVRVVDMGGHTVREYRPNVPIEGEIGLCISEDTVYMSSAVNNTIYTCYKSEEIAHPWSEESAELLGPHYLELLEDEEIYVSNWSNHCISVLDPDGNYLRSIGSFGNYNKEFTSPYGLCQRDGLLFVSDCLNHRVMVLASKPVCLLSEKLHGIRFPSCVKVTPCGRYIILAHSRNKVSIFGPESSNSV